MGTATDILRGELERLFTLSGLESLARDYLGLDPREIKTGDDPKAVVVRHLMDWCRRHHAVEALADILLSQKRGMVDPRLRQAFESSEVEPPSDHEVFAGFKAGARIFDTELGAMFHAVPVDGNAPSPDWGIEVVRRDLVADPSAAQRFLVGLRLYRDLDHPRLQKIKDAGLLEDGRPFMIASLVGGDPLSDAKPMTLERLLPLTSQVLEALDVLHAKGLVHGDVKPENVRVIEEDGMPGAVLTGFGTDRLRSRLRLDPGRTGRITLLGSPKSLAPEQIRGAETDPRTDLWGVACMMVEMLTGRPAFQAPNGIETAMAILTHNPEPPSKGLKTGVAPADLDDIVLRALSRDPARRPADASQMLTALRRLSAAESAAPEEVGSLEDIAPAVDLFLENPADEGLLEQLEEEARDRRAWRPAAETIEKAAEEMASIETRKVLLFRVARIYEAELRDAAKAEATYLRILEIDPEDGFAEAAITELKKRAGRFEEAVEILSQRAAKTSDRDEKLAILQEIADICEHDLRDYGKAFDLHLLLLGEGSVTPERIRSLEALAEKTDRWNDTVQAVTSSLTLVADPDENLRCCRKLGTWYRDRLNRLDFALSCFQQVLSMRPTDPETIEAVIDLYRRSQQWADLARFLVSAAENETMPSLKRDRLVEASVLYVERLNDVDAGRKLLDRVMDEDPTHTEALKLLEKVHTRTEDWQRLALLYERMLHATAGEEATAIQYRLGELYEDRLSDLDNALECYRDVLAKQPDHLEALKGLDRIFARKEDYRSLLDNLQRQIAIAATPRQKIQLHERLAALHEEEFRDAKSAIISYEAVTELDPAHASALAALARLYRKEQRWEDLAEVLQTQVDLADTQEQKIDILKARAQVFDEKLGRATSAAEVLAEVARIAGSDESTLEQLARSQEESKDFAGLVKTLEQMVQSTQSKTVKATLYVRLARAYDQGLGDFEASIASLRRAVDANSDNANALSALREAYVRKGDFANALEMHQKELKITDGDLARAEVISEMGVLCIKHLEDEDRAIEYFEQALNLDPNCLKAADHVCALYRKRDRWADAQVIYERFYQSVDALPHDLAIDLLTHMGEAFTHLGDPEHALEMFAEARKRAGDDPYLIKSLGNAALAIDNAEVAQASFLEFIEKFGDRASVADRLEAYVGRAKALLFLGNREGEALQSAQKAYALSPDHVPALRILADIHLRVKAWRDAVEIKRKLLALLKNKDEQIGLLKEIAFLESDQLKNNEEAIRTLGLLMELDPQNRDALHLLMKIFSTLGRWSDVVEVVLKIADQVEDKGQLSKYYLTVGKIYRRELKQTDEALTYLDMALDEDPSLLNAFDTIVQIHTEAQDWKGLERAYRKMISRLPQTFDPQTRINLWRSLAELYIHRLDRVDDAVIVLETIRKLAPDDRKWMEELSELYGWEAKYADKAIALHHDLLRQNPLRVESFRGLRRIYSEQNRPDEAWCLSQVLTLLRAGDEEEQAYYREFRPEDIAALGKSLEEGDWGRFLFHPDLDPLVTSIFALIQPAILAEKALPHKNYELKPDGAVNLDTDANDFTQLVKFTAGTLGLTPPAVFYEAGRPIGLAFAHTAPPSLVIGARALELNDRIGTTFTLGQYLTYARPGFYVRQLLSSGTEMGAWLLAAIKIFAPQLPAPKDQVAVVSEALSVLKKKLDKASQEKLREHVHSFLASGGEVNLKKWGTAVDYTADRAGLVLVNELGTCLKQLKDLSDAAGATPSRDRIKELTLYSISDPYFSLRRYLGIALEPG